MSVHQSNDKAERLLVNGRFFSTDKSEHGKPFFYDYMHIKDDKISRIGNKDDEQFQRLENSGISVQDVSGNIVLPGFFDAHLHLLLLGQSLQKLDIYACQNLEDIRKAVKQYADANPQSARILCRGYMQRMTDSTCTADMLEKLTDRPIFIESRDLHSTWCNAAALEEVKDLIQTDIPGGVIQRDETGKPTGLLSEAANISVMWPYLARVATLEEKSTALEAAIDRYNAAGYTGMVDMAMDENAWGALLELRKQKGGSLSVRLAAYWLILPGSGEEERLRQVDRAIELSKQFNSKTSPDLRIVGIKLICDGIIDSCTAALLEPYTNNGTSEDPIWTAEMLEPVVKKAEEAGLQCALHAIGDKTVRLAIDTIEQYCSLGKRHRIEHLEMTSPEDARRLGQLGITASVQPVHSDPAILRAWPKLLGDKRLKRAFAYKDFADGNAPLAIGSDAPTAPEMPLHNLYVATTRKSAREPGPDAMPVNPEQTLDLCQAIAGATYGSAYSCFAESRTGSLRTGLQADFVIIDMEYDPETLLQATVKETWIGGRRVYDSLKNSSN